MPDAAATISITRPGGWAIVRRNRPAMISLGFLVLLVLVAFTLPFTLDDGLKATSDSAFLAPFSKDGTTGLLHLLGTDVNGQDLFYRLLTGAQVSLGVGIIGALISLFIGTAYGMISGYFGGRVDAAMMRLVDMLYAVPRILFIMIFIAAFDSVFKDWLDGIRLGAQAQHWPRMEEVARYLIPYSKILVMILSLGLVEWLTMARIIRGQVLVLREMTFVTASRAMGQSRWVILRKHLLPNLSTIILTYLTLTIPAVILDESFLSFLGLGIEDPAASWGSLLKDGAQVINPIESKWWLLAFPALLMSSTLLALNFLGDGLRDAFDPKSTD
ncbi:peptide/nickel transport system permease protein [Prosthecobacter debontii]|uniref:Oligopeptide transport system permease protein OppC n=1 Tax=Prosthecobacter debontii TaxID=48467 RepID=A0A1T4WDZ0_9BACT|nr:ABC transporter permease [Prosthecobacter debontii]SKA75500.1 peptide/nickel transport system permease protein [Prosthecobacter debontii]